MSVAGSLIGQNLTEVDPQRFLKGLTDILDQNQPEFSAEEANAIIQNYLQEVSEKQFQQFKTEGEAFLKENATKPGVHVTSTGLQYEIIEGGVDKKPAATDTVTVHYHGTLIDGTVFDSSVERGTPAQFGVHQVIPGWTEALQLMSEGAKYRLYIPQELAYGANPHPGGAIKPFMTLIFDVELIAVN
jgi:FKBP-type peptidyl-prolyl cis-trans isomerase FklB